MARTCCRLPVSKSCYCCVIATSIASLLPALYFTVEYRFLSATSECFMEAEGNMEATIRDFNNRLAHGLFAKYSVTPRTFDGEDTWREVLPRVYVYSAFLSRISKDSGLSVRFISIIPNADPLTGNETVGIRCRIRAGYLSFITSLKLDLVPEDHGRQLSAATMVCPVNDANFLECSGCTRVEAALELPGQPLVWIDVQQPIQIENYDPVSVCVRPLFGSFDNLIRIAEFITYYSVIGVNQFSFYMYEASYSVEHLLRVLRDHQSVGLRIYRWNLPLNDSLIHAHGQLAFTQDCILRGKLTSRYVTVVDLDEFIVPKLKPTLSEALVALEQAYNKETVGSFNVLNRLFCAEFPPVATLLGSDPPLLSRLYTVREVAPWSHHIRSKYIARTDATVTGGIHFIWEHELGKQEVQLPEDIMVMHHYRSCCGMTQAQWFHLRTISVLRNAGQVADSEMERFMKKMLKHRVLTFVMSLL